MYKAVLGSVLGVQRRAGPIGPLPGRESILGRLGDKRGEKFAHLRWHSAGEEIKPGGSKACEWGIRVRRLGKSCDKVMLHLRSN